jgi:lysophospholipase L1-like esterase
MSWLSVRRDLRLAGVVTAAASLVVVACGSSNKAPNDTSSGTDGGTSSSSNATDGSTPSSADDAGDANVPQVDASACPATADEIVLIGDSYFALSGEITTKLQSLATAGGALATGASYRHYYRSGANMYPYSDSTVTTIPAQFTEAVTTSADIKYVIMDGGGNDILLENSACIDSDDAATPDDQTCSTAVNNAITTAKTLFQTMSTAGVEKLIYFFYPHLPTSGKPDVNVMVDDAYPLVQAACAAAPLPCYFIDTRAAFTGHPEYIGTDGIHPTTAGSDVIAGLIWGVMQDECVAL